VRVLAEHLAALHPLLEGGARVLDVGSGDGRLASALIELRPDLEVEGCDVLPRPDAVIPTTAFDGVTLPHADDAFDAVMLVDVLHHADDPPALLGEAARVARACVVVKDHNRTGFAGALTLRFMDWVGNKPHGVPLPYNYLSPAEWAAAYRELGLRVDEIRERLGLYPAPFTWIFDRSLHFAARIVPCDA
jgi:SAM-dependent methyltransferase